MGIRFFRFAGPTMVLLAGLTTATTRAADATLPQGGGFATVHAMPNEPVIERRKIIAVSDLPDERGSVVLIYQGVAMPGSAFSER